MRTMTGILFILLLGLAEVSLAGSLSSASFQTTTSLQTSPRIARKALPNSQLRPHSLALEAGGRGGLYSLNYDMSFSRYLSLGAGFSYLSVGIGPVEAQLITIPLYANYYFNPHRHRFFMTAGMSIMNLDVNVRSFETGGRVGSQTDQYSFMLKDFDLVDATIPLPSAGIGYELMTNQGWLCRIQAYMVYLVPVEKFIPWPGITFGGTF